MLLYTVPTCQVSGLQFLQLHPCLLSKYAVSMCLVDLFLNL